MNDWRIDPESPTAFVLKLAQTLSTNLDFPVCVPDRKPYDGT